MNSRSRIDHIVIGTSNLILGTSALESKLSHQFSLGGEHKIMGTHNKLLKLQSNIYLEVIAKNPNADKLTRPRWFSLDENNIIEKIKNTPRALCWVLEVENIEDVDFLDSLEIPAFKLASIHAVEPYFINYAAQKGRPLILSTGMATLLEVEKAVTTIRTAGNEDFVLLQCTTNYPSRLEDANLRAIKTIGEAFNVIVGYSDHTQDDTACIVSVALGAKVIEKHFTLDKTLPGPDQSSSYDPEEFSRLVVSIRNAEKVLGSARKEPCEIEKINAEIRLLIRLFKIILTHSQLVAPSAKSS